MEGMNDYRHTVFSVVLSVLQAFVLSWLGVVLFAVFAFTVEASSPALVDARWQDAAVVGSQFWVVALGGKAHLGAGIFSLNPLLLTAIVMALTWWFMKKRDISSWWHILAACATSGTSVLALSFVGYSGYVQLKGPVVAGVLVGALSIAQWWRRNPPDWRLYRMMRPAWTLAARTNMVLGVFALVITAASTIINWSSIAQINGYYILNALATTVFTIVQILFLPNALVWSLAFASGAGFAIGTGTSFSSVSISSAPLPAIPLLGALPSPGVSMAWLIVCMVLGGALIGMHGGDRFIRITTALRYGGIASAILFVGMLALGFLATGGIGEGRMEHLGVTPAIFAAVVTLEVGGGLVLGLVARNGQTHSFVKDRVHALRHRGEPIPASGAEADAAPQELTDDGAEGAGSRSRAERVRGWWGALTRKKPSGTGAPSGAELGAEATVSDGLSGDTGSIDAERATPVTAPTAATADGAHVSGENSDAVGEDKSAEASSTARPTPLESYKQKYARRPIIPPPDIAPTAATASLATTDFIPTAATAFSPPTAEPSAPSAE